MTAAVLSSAFTRDVHTSSRLSQLAKRLVNALVESRVRSVERDLRRREAFLGDLGRRQDHSSAFLDQSDLLPFKI